MSSKCPPNEGKTWPSPSCWSSGCFHGVQAPSPHWQANLLLTPHISRLRLPACSDPSILQSVVVRLLLPQPTLPNLSLEQIPLTASLIWHLCYCSNPSCINHIGCPPKRISSFQCIALQWKSKSMNYHITVVDRINPNIFVTHSSTSCAPSARRCSLPHKFPNNFMSFPRCTQCETSP